MIAETLNSATGFTATQWITNGGSAIAVDDPPNTTSPPANRILTIPPSNPFLAALPNAPSLNAIPATTASVFAADGTSLQGRMWWRDDVQGTWVALTATVTLTYASTNSNNLNIRCVPGSKFFFQVAANTGVTKVAIVVR